MKERLTSIAQAEGMMTDGSPSSLREGQIDAILQVAGGDMRRAVTSLQSVHALLSGGDPGVVVDGAVIAELAGLPPDSVIDGLYRSLRSNRFDVMQGAVQDCIMANGYSVQTVLQKLLVKFTDCPEDELDELGRARLAIRIAEAEYKMNEGADEYLQLMTVCGLALQCLYEASSKTEQ